jgi:Protein of unknown function (DUF4238)
VADQISPNCGRGRQQSRTRRLWKIQKYCRSLRNAAQTGAMWYPIGMDKRSANEKKRHHFIPITYLNKFADTEGRVFAYRKDDPETALHLRPDAIAFERYYYSQPLPDGGRDNNTFENFFGTIESTWNRLAERLCSPAAINFTSSEFGDLFTFLILMRVRVPAARDMVEVTLSEQVKATTRLLDRQGKLPPKPAGLPDDILDHLSVAIDPHMSLHAIPHLARGFGILLNHLGFEVLHNKTDVSLVTSDNPVVCFDPTVPEGRVLPYQVRPPHGSMELLFPIDAATVLRGHTRLRRAGHRSLGHAVLTDRQQAKRVNRFIVRFGYRFVFARDRSHEALIVRHASTSPVIDMVSGCVFGPRPTKPKWEA